jgi:hypothetical protein
MEVLREKKTESTQKGKGKRVGTVSTIYKSRENNTCIAIEFD